MGVAEKLRLFLVINSYTYNLISRLRATRQDRIALQAERRIKRIARAYDRWSWCDWEWDDQTKTNVAHSLDLMKRLVRFCQSKGVRIMVTSVPHYWQYSGNADGSGTPRWSPKPHGAIKKMCTELKVPYLNSFEALRPRIAGTQQTEYYYEANMHFNPYGYALWAEAHYDFLMDPQQALLPSEAYSAR